MNDPRSMSLAPAAKPFPLRWPLALAAGALLVALAARVSIPLPFTPVPVTLQGPAVILVGGLFGAAIGAGAMVLYLTAGVLGAPVFHAGASGLPVLFGPTGGYLLAFPVAAAIVGRVAVRGHLWRCLLAGLLGMAMIHLGGWAQLSVLTGSPAHALTVGTFPFLAQDVLKATLAGLVVWRSHHLLRLGS